MSQRRDRRASSVRSSRGGDVRDDAQSDRERNGLIARRALIALRIARASWLVGVTVREYREIEAGTKAPDWDTYERVCELFGWPRSFTSLLGDGWGAIGRSCRS